MRPRFRPSWLDLCCGTGRALLQAAYQLRRGGLADRIALVGVDLVDFFDPIPAVDLPVELVTAPVTSWAPARRFDLITCVHGLGACGAEFLARCGMRAAAARPSLIDAAECVEYVSDHNLRMAVLRTAHDMP